MQTKTPTLPKGKKVKLGDGREGVVVRKEERAGFQGYIVKIVSSPDKSQIGTTVGMTIPGLKEAQVQPKPMATEVSMVSGVQDITFKDMLEKLKKITKEQEISTQRTLQDKQRELTQIQQLTAQVKPPQPSDPMEELDRLEEAEQEELQQQESVNLQQQMLQQQQQQVQQFNIQQQQQMQKISFLMLAHPEHANVEITFDKIAVLCDVAATPKQQATGLQVYESLPRNRGLWFPMYTRRVASFHMGDVTFPIDIVFVDQDHVTKIVAGIQPCQMGSWSAQCTDVVEVNAGWCDDNGVHVGSKVQTPLAGKKRARTEVEHIINRSWSAPQKARITSEPQTYDMLRTITEADTQEDPLLQEVEALFPHLKQAQENYKVKPVTYREQPGEVDLRNPVERFRDHDLPPVSSPQGEDAPNTTIDPYDRDNWSMELGANPLFVPESRPSQLEKIKTNVGPTEGEQVTRPASKEAQVRIEAPQPATELAGVDPQKLAKGSLKLYSDHTPEWGEVDDPRGYQEMAVIRDATISDWIDSLGWSDHNASTLRKVVFTDTYKNLLGEALLSAGEVSNFEILGSDLLLYR